MKVVIAMDSLKGSLSSLEAGEAVRTGILDAIPGAEVLVRPLADGGEGTVEAITKGMGGTFVELMVTGPLGKPVKCTYGLLEKSKTAIVEMSGAAGITLISEEEKNPLHTTTYGVGEVIKDGIHKGARHFIVGIGGSSTNDGGVGMLQALGYKMLDKGGKPIPFGAKGLKELHSISDEEVLPELKDCHFRIACDVENILCGEKGCSAIYGPQKGASPAMINEMDQWLWNYSMITSEKYPKANPLQKGTGAAGGLGFAFLAYTNAVLESGIKIVLEETNLEKYIKKADIVITGEGRLDGQTIFGKAPVGVAQIAKKYHKRVFAFSGSVAEDARSCNDHGIDAFFSILQNVTTLPEAMKPETTQKNLSATVSQVFRLIKTYI